MTRRSRVRLVALVAAAVLAASARAQNLDDVPPYKPDEKVAGTLRVWGNDFQTANMKLWEEGFRKFRPDVRFVMNLTSSAAAVPALYFAPSPTNRSCAAPRLTREPPRGSD